MNGIQLGLVRAIEGKMSCLYGLDPAAQAAIDNIVKKHAHRSRTKLLQQLRTWPAENVRKYIETRYRAEDILLATGHARQVWLDAFDAHEKIHGGAHQLSTNE